MSTVKTDSSRYAAIAAAIRAKNGETALYTPAEMAAKIAAITTGAELDYAVVCAAERPAAPVKNTLWVRDGADAPDVRFSLTAPGTPTANMLWIEQGAQSTAPFEPVKNGGITVYPRRARQYSASTAAWTLLRAELYNGTGWVDLCIPIYSSGDECTVMSGGWNVASTSWSTAGSGIPASITKNSDHIFITGNSYKVTGGSGYRLTTVSPLDLTDVERIGMSVSELTGQGMLGVLAQGEKYMDPAACQDVTGASGTTPAETTMDVSALTGMHYICLLMRCTEAKVMTLKAKVHKCWIY